MIFVKHIFDFYQTASQILMKFGSYMHLSNIIQVCSNQGCMTYFHWNMLMRFWLITYHVCMSYFVHFLQILRSFTLKPITRNNSYIMVYYGFLIVCWPFNWCFEEFQQMLKLMVNSGRCDSIHAFSHTQWWITLFP